MPVGGDYSTNDTMIERKGAEVFGDHYDRVALTFIGTESPRWHDFSRGETQRYAPVVKTGNKYVVTHHHVLDRETSGGLRYGHACFWHWVLLRVSRKSANFTVDYTQSRTLFLFHGMYMMPVSGRGAVVTKSLLLQARL